MAFVGKIAHTHNNGTKSLTYTESSIIQKMRYVCTIVSLCPDSFNLLNHKKLDQCHFSFWWICLYKYMSPTEIYLHASVIAPYNCIPTFHQLPNGIVACSSVVNNQLLHLVVAALTRGGLLIGINSEPYV